MIQKFWNKYLGCDDKEVSNGNKFEENGLQAHNIFRSIHGAVDMKLDPQLTKEATAYAEELSNLGRLKYSQKKGIGENLAYGCSSKDGYQLSAADATKGW